MKRNLILAFILLSIISASAQQKVIPLYKGPAPGSENWTWNETENDSNVFHAHTIFNISKPTLTVYPADRTVAQTGTAVIVCPGGGFQSLSIMQEGYAVVKWLQSKGITAFLLKYRLTHTLGGDPYKQALSYEAKGGNPDRARIAQMAFADAQQALTYVRKHVAEYGVLPNHVGIIGFSAGGYLSTASAISYTADNRPDFAASIYGGLPTEMLKNIPQDAPPMFISAASDDPSGSLSSTALYTAWINAKHAAELHIYAKGGHGFGMNEQGLPTDSWKDRFADWLNLQGYLHLAQSTMK